MKLLVCARWLVLLVVFAGALGCGQEHPLGGVAGQVTLDGEPLASGSIRFLPVEGTLGNTAGSAILRGRYQVLREQGLTPGTYRVEIRGLKKTGRQVALGSPAPPGTTIDEEVEAVPPRYNEHSILTAEIQLGRNNASFELVSSVAP